MSSRTFYLRLKKLNYYHADGDIIPWTVTDTPQAIAEFFQAVHEGELGYVDVLEDVDATVAVA